MDSLIVEWLILVLVTPVVIAVVVLLYGFVGCGSFGSSPVTPTPPAKPSKPLNFRAKGAGTNLVKLNWLNTAGTGVTFRVEREKEGDPIKKKFDVPGPATHDDQDGLEEGTTYFYTVQAVAAGLESDPSDKSAATTFPEAPTNVDPRGAEVTQIELAWTNISKAPNVVVQHQSPTDVTPTETKTDKNIPQPRKFTVTQGSSEHKFRVFASTKGFQENVALDDIRSAEMPQKPAKPLAFQAAPMIPEPPPTLAGYCIVQKLASALLKNTGGQVWLTISPPSTGTLKIDRIYLSQPAATGDSWDSAGPLTKVIDIDVDPNEQLSLVATDPPKRLGPIVYNLNQANDLLISFDINANAGDCLYAENLTGATAYYKDASQQAALADRSPNAGDPTGTFGEIQGRHYLITKIEVL